MISDLALQSLHDGDISIRGMTDNEIATEVATQLKSLIEKKRLKIVFHIDFSDRLLAEARKYIRQKKPELSALYYATYFAHCLNWLIVEICRKKKIDDDATRQLIREVNLRAKYTWVMTLLNNRSLKIGFVNSIIRISEIRNSFIHYKWPEKTFDEKQKLLDADFIKKLQVAEFAVKYLRRFTDHQLYRNQGRRVRRILKASVKSKLAK